MLGRSVALFASCGKLATPCLTRTPKSSRQALVPMMKMLSMRHVGHCIHPELQLSRIAQPESEQNCSTYRAYPSVLQQEITPLLNGLHGAANRST